jgi:uncharacterized cupredoxin-like copper-binding protein
LGLSAIGLLTLATACTGQPQVSALPPVQEVVVTASEFKFEPAQITLRKGESVTLTLKNASTTEHDLLVPGLPMPAMSGGSSGGHGGHGATPIAMGDFHLHAGAKQTDRVTFSPEKTGTYDVYCSVPGHKEAGMVAKLVVQ